MPITILHVDDDPGFADLTAEYLERLDDQFDVRVEYDAAAALERIHADPKAIDCIVSDYEMPDIDGLEFLKRVRSQHPDLDIPFILLTGKGSEEIAAEALNAGATSYIQKGGSDVFEYVAQRIRYDVDASRAFRNSQRFDALVNALDDPMYVLDEQGRFTYVNDAFVEVTGYDRTEIIGQNPTLIKDAETVADAEQQLSRLLSDDGPESLTFEVTIRPKEDDPIPCEDHMGLLPYEGEQFRGSLGVLRDISARKERERQLAETKERYQLLVEQNLVGLYILRKGQLIYHNEPFAEVFSRTSDQNALAGTELSSLIDTADRARLEESLARVETGETHSFRRPYIGRTPDGDAVEIELFARGIELDGEPAVIGTVVDTAQEDDSYWELRRERDRLEEFTSIVSHDLRNPLSVAQGNLTLARESDDLPADVADALAETDTALERMDELLSDLLSLAREGNVVNDREPIELPALARSAWDNIEHSDATLQVSATGTIIGDRGRLKSLFENLYRNAIKHSETTVTIEVGDLTDGFYVADDGPGIPPDDREQVFEPGYTTETDGTGFGLSIVAQIADAHGWQIDITDSDSDGAQFEIRGSKQQVRQPAHS